MAQVIGRHGERRRENKTLGRMKKKKKTSRWRREQTLGVVPAGTIRGRNR